MNPHKRKHVPDQNRAKVDFDKVLLELTKQGIGKGALLLVHTSYSGLQCTGLSEEEIIDKLLDFVGSTGTLVMPVIRRFKGEPKPEKILSTDISNLICTYNVKKTQVISGMLPYTLMQKENAVVSHFPFNPLCAVGPLAKPMMEHNLDGELPSAHGPNSAWKFCFDHNAHYISLGVDLERHCTMVHVAEEAFGDWHWSDEEWYRIRKFNIKDEAGNVIYKEVKERKPKWGMQHMAEMKMAHDFIKKGIIKVFHVDGQIEMGISKAQDIISFLRSKNKNGYPYYR